MFLLGRPWLFALAAMGIDAGWLGLDRHLAVDELPRFRQHRYDARATTIVIAESAAMALVPLSGARAAVPGWARRRSDAPATQGCAATLVLAGMVLVAVGVGQGFAPSRLPITMAAEQREIAPVDHAGPTVRRGEQLFQIDGSVACHTLAAGGSDGRRGPRLDVEIQGEQRRKTGSHTL